MKTTITKKLNGNLIFFELEEEDVVLNFYQALVFSEKDECICGSTEIKYEKRVVKTGDIFV